MDMPVGSGDCSLEAPAGYGEKAGATPSSQHTSPPGTKNTKVWDGSAYIPGVGTPQGDPHLILYPVFSF